MMYTRVDQTVLKLLAYFFKYTTELHATVIDYLATIS